MRVHGIPVQPVGYRPPPRHRREREEKDYPTEAPTADTQSDPVDETTRSEAARSVFDAGANKQRLLLIV